MSIAIIVGKLFINCTKTMNNFHEDSKDFVSVIITLEKFLSGGVTVVIM